MKLHALMSLTGGLAVGYLLGTAAGHTRYEHLKQGATTLAHHPKVEQLLFDLAGHVEANSNRLPGPAGDLIDTAAATVQDKLTQPANDDVTTKSGDF